MNASVLSHPIPFRSMILSAEEVHTRRRSARFALGVGIAITVAALSLHLLAPAAWPDSARLVVHGLQVATFVSGLGWLTRGAWLVRRFGAVRDKAVNAALILAKNHDPQLERALFAIEQQKRTVSRVEAQRMLARYYKEF